MNRAAHYGENRFFWMSASLSWLIALQPNALCSNRHCVSCGYQAHGIIRCPDTMESQIAVGKSSAILHHVSCF